MFLTFAVGQLFLVLKISLWLDKIKGKMIVPKCFLVNLGNNFLIWIFAILSILFRALV